VTSELAGTRQRAEEVGALLVHELSGGAVRIDDHPADRIDGESIALPNSECREDLDRFGDVAQRLASAPSNRWKLGLHCVRELFDQLHGLLVAVSASVSAVKPARSAKTNVPAPSVIAGKRY
jgi:hypothetical protein